ncbi:MAG: insulinase family protein [Lachnospiraceae bacterium]
MDEKQKNNREIISNTGFKIDNIRELPEIKSALYQMHFEKNGAKLIWLDRREENKTFAIAFKTLPNDDTGVFHILEHSLLCGSGKYPVSKPFVEMIKSSLQTFMNAFTFPDKTMYPVCSRNDRDFLNLMDVYLDAVFHPLCMTKKDIFLQEGWHYEMNEPEGSLTCNGVVYNEMKGVFASPDAVIDRELNRLLFPDNCYQYQSGGDPEHITELTYEKYKESYARFYHPSNSYIILDGSMDIEKVLAKLEKVLNEFDRQEMDCDIRIQEPVKPDEVKCSYEIGQNEDAENKILLAGGWVYGQFDEQEKNTACSVLADFLCSSNESPLRKAVLEKGLAENVELTRMDGIEQPYLVLVVRNTREEKREEVWRTIQDTLKELAAGGLDHRRLEAILSRMEFQTREKEPGMYPAGIANAMKILESSLYGGDPAQNLCWGHVYQSLRNKIDEGYFEELLKEVMLEGGHCARLVLYPSKTLGEEKRSREEARLKQIKEQWSGEEKQQIIREFSYLRKAQQTPDSKEQLSALPRLSLSDIPEKIKEIPQAVTQIEGRRVLLHKLETEGIVHISYYLSLADMTLEELSMVSFLRTLLGQTETENYSALKLQEEIEGNLGRFQAYVDVYAKQGQTEECTPYLVIQVSVLKEKLEEALRLTGEVVNGSRFGDIQYLRTRVRQLRINMEQHILMNGNSYASTVVAAGFSARGAVKEALQGIGMLRFIQNLDNNFEKESDSLVQKLEGLCKKIFVRERMTLGITGDIENVWLIQLIRLLADRPNRVGEPVKYPSAEAGKKGILIPAEIGFAGKGANLNIGKNVYHGAMKTAARILSYGYLWNEVRVKGGAYGTGLTVSGNGDVIFTSFRDPGAADSLKVFDGAAAALRSVIGSGESLDRYIVSTIASTEPLLSVRQKGIQAAEYYLSGVTAGMLQKERCEILHTSKEDLLMVSEMLDEIAEHAGVCIIGGKTSLDTAGTVLTQTESL